MWVAIDLHLFQPVLTVSESIPASNVVDQQCPDSTAIVRPSNRTEVLLTCGVPYLQLDVLVADFDCFGTELHSDGDVVGTTRLVFDEL